MKRLNKTSLNYDEMDILPLFPNQNSRLLRKEMVSTLYEYYLVDDIVSYICAQVSLKVLPKVN